MTIEPFKYLIQPVVVERDDDTGRVLREMPAEVVTVYSAAQATEAIVQFEAQLTQLQQGEVDVHNGNTAAAGTGDPVRTAAT